MTVLDAALGVAAQSKLPAGRAFTTLETKVNMVRAIRPNLEALRCEAHAIHVGGEPALPKLDCWVRMGRCMHTEPLRV